MAKQLNYNLKDLNSFFKIRVPIPWLKEYRQEIETALGSFMEAVLTKDSLDAPEQDLADAVSYAVTGSGKRIRPLLGLLAFETSAPSTGPEARKNAIRCLLSVEFLHCSSLIHDDLPAMDNDQLRRGKPTVWKVYGEDGAILAGNVLNFLTFEVLAKYSTREVLPEAVALLAETAGIHGLNGGQMRDLSLRPIADIDWLKATHRKKTGVLIRASIGLGAILGNADLKTKRLLAEYADAVGLAFQIKDDLLDALGDERIVGKKLQKDAAKKGFVYFLGMQNTVQELDKLIESAVQAADRLQNHKLAQFAEYIRSRNH